MRSEFNTPDEVSAEIRRLTEVYNDMTRPRTANGALLKDGDVVEIISPTVSDLSGCSIGDQGKVVILLSGFRVVFSDGRFINLDYRSARYLRIVESVE